VDENDEKRMLHHVHEYTATDNGFSWFLNKQQSSAAMQGEDAGGVYFTKKIHASGDSNPCRHLAKARDFS
jgi:hypothetical protein